MPRQFETGDRVVLIGGPFHHHQGVVQVVSSDGLEVRVLISVFGREAPIVTAADVLDWVDDTPDEEIEKRLA